LYDDFQRDIYCHISKEKVFEKVAEYVEFDIPAQSIWAVMGTESVSRDPLVRKDYYKFLKEIHNNPGEYEILATEIKGSKYENLFMPDDIYDVKTIAGLQHLVRPATLLDVIERTINDDKLISKFIFDDFTDKTIGLVAYHENDLIITTFKLFTFNVVHQYYIGKDLTFFIDDLANTHLEVHWKAKKSNTATHGYDSYIKRKNKQEGFRAEREWGKQPYEIDGVKKYIDVYDYSIFNEILNKKEPV
jgi:hypothetical protein